MENICYLEQLNRHVFTGHQTIKCARFLPKQLHLVNTVSCCFESINGFHSLWLAYVQRLNWRVSTYRSANLTNAASLIYSLSSEIYLYWHLARITYLEIKSLWVLVLAVHLCLQSIPWHQQLRGNLMLATQAL